MSITSIGNGSGGQIAEELLQKLTADLARSLTSLSDAKDPSAVSGVNGVDKPGAGPQQGVGPPNTLAGPQAIANLPLTDLRTAGLRPLGDVASVLLAEVATADLTKLTRILDPLPDPMNNRILASLLERAVQEIANGNVERAVGYLADYATRDPHRAEALPMEPALVDMRDKIDSMVGRMTIVAKMSAEDGLSRAEQVSIEKAGKLTNWETHADVLIKLAHRFFDAGGYANYSRTTELTRLVSDTAASEGKPAIRALAAAASAAVSNAAGTVPNQMLPGVNVPYWASPDIPSIRTTEQAGVLERRRFLTTPLDDVLQNMRDLKEVASNAWRQLWIRAPLLVMLMVWFAAGLTGSIAFAIASRISPDGLVVRVSGLALDLWGIGFLALVGFGFYMRVRHRR